MNILEKFKYHLKNNLPQVNSYHPFFNEALARMLLAGGKHFRAQLLLGVIECEDPLLLDDSMDVALALEFIHTYSLIHDDLPSMDNADFRRNIATLHKVYDETTAILIGDALNTEAFLLLSKTNFDDNIKIKLIKTLAYNAGINGMVLGQALDCFFEHKKLDLKQLEFLHIHKTAKLIAAALKMGCEICKMDDKSSQYIYDFGLKLGLAFQINDDIIDTSKSAIQLGKPNQKDTYKNSFVNLFGIKKAIDIKNEILIDCENKLVNINTKLSTFLKKLIKDYLQN